MNLKRKLFKIYYSIYEWFSFVRTVPSLASAKWNGIAEAYPSADVLWKLELLVKRLLQHEALTLVVFEKLGGKRRKYKRFLKFIER